MRPPRGGRGGDEGMTLIETAITCAVLAVVLAAAFPIVNLVYGLTTNVQNTFSAVDQLVLASEVVTRYVHEAVANAPGGNPFVSATANSATFYADTGNANGPVQVVAQVTTTKGIRSFKIVLTPPVAGSCPTAANPNATCTYGASPDGTVLISYLNNGTVGVPVFTYTLVGGSLCAGPPPGSGGTSLTAQLVSGTSYTSLSVLALTTAVASGDTLVIGTGSSAQSVTASAAAAVGATTIAVTKFAASSTWANGTSVFDQSCSATQVSQVSAVGLNLLATQTPDGQPTGYQSEAYLMSPNYNVAVG